MRQKILVTGANGQLGSELRELSPAYPQFEFNFLSREELAINDPAKLQALFSSFQPQFCINCAAYTAVDKAELETERAAVFEINANAVESLAVLSKQYQTSLIHISTDYVFNGNGKVPYKEADPVDPVNVYGASKLEGEQLAIKANPATVIIRTSWVYSSYGKNFVKTMLRLMKEKAELNVVSDQYGCPTYAADLADAIMQIILYNQSTDSSADPGGIYHFSNSGVISWFDFAVVIKELSGLSCHINAIPTSSYPTPAKRPFYSVMSNDKIQKQFGIKSRDWKQSLEICLEKLHKK